MNCLKCPSPFSDSNPSIESGLKSFSLLLVCDRAMRAPAAPHRHGSARARASGQPRCPHGSARPRARAGGQPVAPMAAPAAPI
jgi:hypothetical protein